MAYIAIHGVGSGTSGEKFELLEKLENWKKGTTVGKGRTTLPSYIEKELADRIATQR